MTFKIAHPYEKVKYIINQMNTINHIMGNGSLYILKNVGIKGPQYTYTTNVSWGNISIKGCVYVW